MELSTSGRNSVSSRSSSTVFQKEPGNRPPARAVADPSLLKDVRLKLPSVARNEKKSKPGLWYLYTRSWTAGSYGLMAGSSLSRSGGMVAGTDAIGAAPFLSVIYMAALSLDAHYTHKDGKAQKASSAAGQTRLQELCSQIEKLTGSDKPLEAAQLRSLQGNASKLLTENKDLQKEALQICDLITSLHGQARSLAASTPKVLIQQDNLKAWRDHMVHKLGRLEQTPAAHHTKRSIKRMARLKSLIQMYDVLGEDVLKTIYVNLSCTQAKQVRDVVLYGINVSLGTPMQAAGAADTLSKLTHHGGVLPTEVLSAFSGIGMLLSLLSIFSNYIDAFKDAPRELKRASVAKQLVHRQMSGLAHVLHPDETCSPGTAAQDGVVPPQASLLTLIHQRKGRYTELHRITNQAWIRRTKGFFGIGLGSLSFASQAATIACAAVGAALGAVAVSWASAGISAAAVVVGTAYLSTIVQGGLSRKLRKDRMRADEAIARIYLRSINPQSLHELMSGQYRGPSPLAGITEDRVNQLQLSSRVRKLVMKQLAGVKADPALLQRNVYLASIHLAMTWLSATHDGATDSTDPVTQALIELPAQLNIPAPQVAQVRNMVIAGSAPADIFAKTQQMFFGAFGLELKIHDDADDLKADYRSTVDDTAIRQFLASIPDHFWTAMLARNPASKSPAAPPKPAPVPDTHGAAHKLQRLITQTTQADRRTADQAKAELMAHAWTFVWETIRADARASMRIPGRSWHNAGRVLENWKRSPGRMTVRNERIRARLKDKMHRHFSAVTGNDQALPQDTESDFIDELLQAAVRQATHLDQAATSSAKGGSSPGGPVPGSRYLAVGELARLLLNSNTGP